MASRSRSRSRGREGAAADAANNDTGNLEDVRLRCFRLLGICWKIPRCVAKILPLTTLHSSNLQVDTLPSLGAYEAIMP